jgi:hypothetical protein
MSIKTFPFARVGLILHIVGVVWMWLHDPPALGSGWVVDAPLYPPAQAIGLTGIGLLLASGIRAMVLRLRS